MDQYTKAKEKLAVIFNQSPWLKTDGKAVHLPISGLEKDHQLTWPELYALYRESDNYVPCAIGTLHKAHRTADGSPLTVAVIPARL